MINEEDYLEECKKLLLYFHKDLSKDFIEVGSGDYSCIMNRNSEFCELFGGMSIRSVCEYVAGKMNKKIKYNN